MFQAVSKQASPPRKKFRWTLGVLICVAVLAGCQMDNHPWKGAGYQRPNGAGNPISSTYAPMPQILPQVTIDTSTQSDGPSETLEEFDMDLSELLNQLKSPQVIKH